MGGNLPFTYSFSTVPQEILTGTDVVTQESIASDPATGERYRVPGLGVTPLSFYLTLLTSMFMHGGLMHLLGNMLYLHIFGDNIENLMGHLRYLIFYLTCGVLSHISGACLRQRRPGCRSARSQPGGLPERFPASWGGYFLPFPKRRVRVLIFRFISEVPALVAIGVWFAFQLISSLGMFSGGSGGGVAYGAHIGGFIAGLILVKLFLIGVYSKGRLSFP